VAIKKLVLNDFLEEENFSLIGIHCTIEDYRLAYMLNKTLELKLVRQDNDIDNNNNKTAFSIFEWEDNTHFKTWNLVSNVCRLITNQIDNTKDSLFSFNPSVTKTHYLVPEFSKANYLLKTNNEFQSKKEKFILEKILKIDQVITAYTIPYNSLKSKDQLIFN